MPFIDPQEKLRDHLPKDGPNVPLVIGIVSVVIVVLVFAGTSIFGVLDGNSLTFGKGESIQTQDGSGGNGKDKQVETGKRTGDDESDGKKPASDSQDAAAQDEKLVVYVCGSVGKPGVYEFQAGSRIRDAIDRAGGFTEDAAAEALNLAQEIHDEEQIRVPSLEEYQAGAATLPMDATAGGSTSSGSAESQAGGLVNINTASQSELISLPGVGEATAQKIIASRENEGPFQSPEDLMRVSGIGEKKFESLRDLICV